MTDSNSESPNRETSQNSDELSNNYKVMIDEMPEEDDKGTTIDISFDRIRERFKQNQ